MEALLLGCLDALHFSLPEGTKLSQSHFRGRQASATVRQVLYFLYSTYDKKAAGSRLKTIWPVQGGESDKLFRGEMVHWIATLQDDAFAAPYVEGFNAALLLLPKTQQCSRFLASLSVLLLHRKLRHSLNFSSPSTSSKCLAWKLEIIKKITLRTQSENSKYMEELNAFKSEKESVVLLLERKRADRELSIKRLQARMERFVSDDELMRIEVFCRRMRVEERGLKEKVDSINKAVATLHRSEHIIDLPSLIDTLSEFLSSSGLVDVVGIFKYCTAMAKKLSSQFDKKGCTLHDLELAALHVSASRTTLRRLQEKRKALWTMKAVVEQCQSAAVKKPFVTLDHEDTDEMDTPSAQPAARPDVKEFVNKLLAAHRNHTYD